MLPPKSDPLLCDETRGIVDYTDPAGNADIFDPDTRLSGFEGGLMLLVPRGGCSFESKARSAQRLGASGVLVRNTLDSRYGLLVDDGAAADVVDGAADDGTGTAPPDWPNTRWPVGGYDYECGDRAARHGFGWRSEVDPLALSFDPPPYGDGPDGTNDALLSGPGVDGNLCAIGVAADDATRPPSDGSGSGSATTTTTFESRCPSMRCLLTGRNGTYNPAHLEACCAWDELQPMGSDGDNDGDAIPPGAEEDIAIPALFVTMEKGYELYDLVMDAIAENAVSVGSAKYVAVVPYGRYRPAVHYATMLLWALAIYALWVSSRRSAKEYGER